MSDDFVRKILEPALIAVMHYELERRERLFSSFPTNERLRRGRYVRKSVNFCLARARMQSENPNATNRDILAPYGSMVRSELAVYLDSLIDFAEAHGLR